MKLSRAETLDLLDTQPAARHCVPVADLPVCKDDQSEGTAVDLPARGPSIILPADRFNAFKTAAEEACRELGNRCNYEKLEGMIQGGAQ